MFSFHTSMRYHVLLQFLLPLETFSTLAASGTIVVSLLMDFQVGHRKETAFAFITLIFKCIRVLGFVGHQVLATGKIFAAKFAFVARILFVNTLLVCSTTLEGWKIFSAFVTSVRCIMVPFRIFFLSR